MPRPDPPICDYEGSDYQASFWDHGGREYEDRVEAIALGRLLPAAGNLLLEVGAGAGRNTSRYEGFRRIVLLDYSRSQLKQAQDRLGRSGRYILVAADAYRLPFVDGIFDAATMIRVLHHLADAPRALSQLRGALKGAGTLVLEFANKRNLKAILRFWSGRQAWSPFAPEPVEFAKLNFDFHPRAVAGWLRDLGFTVDRKLTVSHFRSGALKRMIPTSLLVALDSFLQPTGSIWQLTPSVFLRARAGSGIAAAGEARSDPASLFKCPHCAHAPLAEHADILRKP
jgi:SAM-dependent methyltransferase